MPSELPPGRLHQLYGPVSVFLMMSAEYRPTIITCQHTEEKHLLESLLLEEGKRVERTLFLANSSTVY